MGDAVLKIEVELISGISPKRNKHKATIEIANVGGTKTSGTYRYTITGSEGRLMNSGHIEGFPRKKLHAVDLLALCLVDARGQRITKKMKE